MTEITQELVNKALSEDYREHFLSEYWQLKIRLQKLDRMLENWEDLDFTPQTPKSILLDQADIMRRYLHILGVRAKIEKIGL